VRWICTTPFAVTGEKLCLSFSTPLKLSCGAAAPSQRIRSQQRAMHLPTYHIITLPSLVATRAYRREMNHELIESWTEKLVQQAGPKRSLDNGSAPGPSRPRQHYPTSEGDRLEQKELEQTKGQGREQLRKEDLDQESRVRHELRSPTTEATLAETETMDRRHDGEADDADERNREQTPRASRPTFNFPLIPTASLASSTASFVSGTTTSTSSAIKRTRSDGATHRGVYTTFSVLLLLTNWAETQYRPWFGKNICNVGSQPLMRQP
jgi:hypothetical protein